MRPAPLRLRRARRRLVGACAIEPVADDGLGHVGTDDHVAIRSHLEVFGSDGRSTRMRLTRQRVLPAGDQENGRKGLNAVFSACQHVTVSRPMAGRIKRMRFELHGDAVFAPMPRQPAAIWSRRVDGPSPRLNPSVPAARRVTAPSRKPHAPSQVSHTNAP
jgi:hypothetical protein